MVKYYTASKSRSQGRKFYSLIFRHPMIKDSGGKSGLRIRKGLGTSNTKKADKLVSQMNEILKDSSLWNIDAMPIAERLYDNIIVSAFYSVLWGKTDVFVIAYESELGKGWDIVEAIDAKKALKLFEEREPDIYKLCQYPHGAIRVAKEENFEKNEIKEIKLIKSKCKNCDDSVITQNNGKDWEHGLILENGKPWLTPINSLCKHPEGQIDTKKRR